jgi:ankyrin repeat protein
MASAWGHLDVVKYLLEQGADPSIRAEVDGTPAKMANARGAQEVVDFFASRD